MDRQVKEYGWKSADGPASCEYLSPAVLDVLRKLKVKRICDVGCGNARLTSHLYNAGYDVVGLDNDIGGIEIARRNYPHIPFYKLGVQDDPVETLAHEPFFEAVVSTEVVEHLFSPRSLPLFAHALLSRGGQLIISTPYHGYLKNLALSLINKWDFHHTPLWEGGHIKFWSRNTLSRLLSDNGFIVQGFYGVGRVPFLWKSMIIVAKINPDWQG